MPNAVRWHKDLWELAMMEIWLRRQAGHRRAIRLTAGPWTQIFTTSDLAVSGRLRSSHGSLSFST